MTVAIAMPAATAYAAPPGASAYVPVSPYRILDTRVPLGYSGRVGAGSAFTLSLTGVPSGSSAVVLNLTVDAPAAAGFVTVYPTGASRPLASSINVDGAGQTIANLVTVPIGTSNSVDLYTLMTTDLIADVQGYYKPATAAKAGLFIPLNPMRLVDTREPSSVHPRPLNGGEQLDLNVAALAGLPADATAAALKVTVTESAASGFWTVFPTGSDRPIVSNLNVVGSGTTIANQVLAQLSNGHATVFAQTGGDLVIDLVGWFTGPSAPSSDVGLFVPVSPSRLLDSREPPLGALPGHNRTAEVPVAGRFGVPTAGVGAVVLNATVTETAAQGFFSVWPARTYRPTASSLNAMRAGQTIANHVITPVSTAGFSFYTQNGAHLIVDLAGWYTGTELSTVLPPPVPLTGPGGPPVTPPFAFSKLLGNAPVRWNPCAAIHYSVNLGGYDGSFRQVITEAVERLEAATGLPLVPVGDTTYMPTSTNGAQFPGATSAVVIALGDELQTDQVPGNVIGRTVITYFATIGRATVVIDMGDINSNAPWSGNGLGPVLMHELGHAVGLDHVNDPTQLMNPFTSPNGPKTYAAGDLTGLWQLGAAAGCIG